MESKIRIYPQPVDQTGVAVPNSKKVIKYRVRSEISSKLESTTAETRVQQSRSALWSEKLSI